LFVLRQLCLVITQSLDGIFRRLHVRVRHHDQLGFALVLESAQPFALLVEQVGGDIDRHLHDDSRGAILTHFLADEPKYRERERFDAADAADAHASWADDVTGFAE
jgi:hypothetical protein